MTTISIQVDEILAQAVEIASLDERKAFIDRACDGQPELQREVERLVSLHFQAGSFLESPGFARTSNAVEPAPERPGTEIGPYKLLQVIGEGGMGVVYMAEQTEPIARRVALKIIKPGMDTRRVIARFEAERQALAVMDHVSIARVLDGGTTPAGLPYFVMELVNGVPITQYCDGKRLTLRQRLELFVPVCQAIQHAHQKGIIHRDIKPTNVLVAEYDEQAIAKLIDFGVAKAVGPRLTEKTMFTEFGQFVGTLEYMSPEQAKLNQLDIDTRSDIYSLGVLLYELLTGTTPFDQSRLQTMAFDETLRIIREDEPLKPSTRLLSSDTLPSVAANRNTEPARLRRAVRGELDWIVMKALEKDRSRRYETASGFARDIERYLNDEPVQACPPSSWYRFGKFARRNRGSLAIACVAALTVLLALVGLTVSNVLITHEKNLKVAALQTAKNNEQAANTQKGIAEQNAANAKEQERIAQTNEKAAKANELLARRRFYAAQMNLAMQAWEAGQPARVLALLESQRPKIDEDDLRTFEWYYLWRLCRGGRRLTLRGHASIVLSIAFSPDGKTLASGSADGTVKLWDLATGQARHTLQVENYVASVAFSPDGKLVATGNWFRSLRLWDAQTGELWKTLQRKDQAWSGADSQGGKNPKRARPVDTRQMDWSVAFSPDGKTLVSGSQDETVVLWDVATGQARATLRGHDVPVLSVAFSPDGSTVASSTAWGTGAKVWDVATCQERFTLAPGHPVVFSRDGTLATGGSVALWDVMSGQQLPRSPEVSATALTFSPDGRALALAGSDRNVRLWDVSTGQMRVHHGRQTRINSIAFSPDGKTLATAGNDTAIELWDVSPPNEPATLTHANGAFALTFSPDGKTLVSGGGSGTKLWDVASGQPTAAFTPGQTRQGTLAFSHDGKTLAIAQGNTVKLVDVITRQQLHTFAGHRGRIVGLAFSPDKQTLGSISEDGNPADHGTLILWDLGTRTARMTIPNLNSRKCLAFSPDGRTLATAGQYLRVELWDAATGAPKPRLLSQDGDHGQWAGTVAFSPDGKILAAGGVHGSLRLWDVETGLLRASLKGHTEEVMPLVFSPDSKTLASGCADRTVKLWDVATGQERVTLKGFAGLNAGMAFSPDGDILAMVCEGRNVKLLRAATDPGAKGRQIELDADDPDNPPGVNSKDWRFWADRGLAHHRLGLRDEAVRDYSKALEIDPSIAWVRNERGLVNLAQSQPDKATADFTQAIAGFSQALQLDSDDAVTLNGRGVAYHGLGQKEKAVADYTRAIELDRGEPKYWINRGCCYDQLGQYDKAVADFTQALELQPSSAKVLKRRGAAYEKLGRKEESLADLARAEELLKLAAPSPDAARPAPQPDEVLLERAAVLRLQDKLAEAEAALREAISLNPLRTATQQSLGELLAQQHRFAEAEPFLSAAVRLAPERLEGYTQLADVLRRLKKFNEAEELLRQAIARDPSKAWLHEALGWALWEHLKYAEAEQAFRVAVRLDPGLANAQFGLGSALQAQRKFEESIEPLRTALRLNPEHPYAPHALGASCNNVKQYAEAETVLQKAIRLAPDDAEAHHNLSWAFLGQSKFTEAAASSRESLRLNPKHRWAPQVLGDALMSQGKVAEAESVLAEMVSREPDNDEWLARLGDVLRQQKKFAEAEAALRKAVKLNPARPGTHESLGWLLWEQQKLAEAELAFREAVRLKPDLANAQFGLGQVLVDHGKYAEAEAPLREVLRLDPKHRWAPGLLKRALAGQGKDEEAKAIQPADQAVQPVPQDNRVKKSDPD